MTRIVVVVALLLAGAGSHASAQAACPAEAVAPKRILSRIVSGEDDADTRERYGLPADLETRLLTDARDAAACARIHGFLETMSSEPDWRMGWDPSFYEVGSFYYVIVAPKPNAKPVSPGRAYIDLRWAALYVLDADFGLVAGIAM
ncbi:MAG TPA: hypothetical protein VHG35_18910 [Gemmatimonadales bacterium]|nr:hypothetical protein [Gemmatimonadales bacterium]